MYFPMYFTNVPHWSTIGSCSNYIGLLNPVKYWKGHWKTSRAVTGQPVGFCNQKT